MSYGWVKLHRQILRNPIFQNDKLFRVFVYLLLSARHTDGEQLIGDTIVPLKAGQWATGRIAISRDTGLTQQNVRTAINKLEKLNILTIKPTTKFSVFSIVNWEKYQQDNQQVTSNQPTSNQQVTTNNNVKNEDNENKTTVEAKPQRSKYSFSDNHMRFSEAIYNKIKLVTPKMKKPNLESWANSARLLNETDGIDLNEAWKVFCWANTDSFWSTNILSLSKFREKYATLEAKMKAGQNQYGGKPQQTRTKVKEFKV